MPSQRQAIGEGYVDPTSTGGKNSSLYSLVDKVLRDPELFPDEFKSWIVRWVNEAATFKIANYQLPAIEIVRTVGAGSTDMTPFVGAWVNYAGGYEVASFYRDPWSRVWLMGMVKSGVSGTTIFNLPGAYRPKARERFIVDTDTGIGRIDITATGDVIHVSGGTGNVSLSGISFRALA